MSILHHAIRKKLTSDTILSDVSVLLHLNGNSIDDTGNTSWYVSEPIILIC